MKHTRCIFVAAVALVAALAPSPRAQEIEGYLDFNRSVEQQIAQLEQLVGGDAAARNQVVVYQWLIELYGYIERLDDVERCYRSILAFFPNDIGTLNNYARFLMDRRGDLARAEEVLADANGWAQAIDERSIDLGTTYQLRAEVRRRIGEYDSAVRLADDALELMSEERGADALRTKAQSLASLEKYDEAAEAYLRLIGLDRGAVAEDVNALKLIAPKTTTHGDGSVADLVDAAVAEQRKREAARLSLEGGQLVDLSAPDGVPLEGTLRRAGGPGAVLFVHDTGGTRSVFTPYAQLLFIDEISSLAVDLRGHGGSRADSMLSYDALSAYNRDHLTDDVAAAFHYLEEQLGLDAAHIAVVAEGSACAVVEKALYRDRIAAPVVYLSPTFPDGDRELGTAVSFRPDRPALLVGAREDLTALRAIQALAGEVHADKDSRPARPNVQTRLYPDAGHGIEALRRVPAALEFVQEWLRRTVGSG